MYAELEKRFQVLHARFTEINKANRYPVPVKNVLVDLTRLAFEGVRLLD
jgi:hypothetical protein